MLQTVAPGEARHRTISETQILDQMLVQGWVFELRAGGGAVVRHEIAAALERMVALGLPYATDDVGQRYFDPVEVRNFIYATGRAGTDWTWEKHYVATTRRKIQLEACGHLLDSGPPDLSRLGARRYNVKFTRCFNLSGLTAGGEARLRLPLPVEDQSLRDLTFTVDAPAALPTRRTPGCYEIRVPTPAADEMTFTVDMTFSVAAHVAARPRQPLAAAERALYTRPAEGLIKVTPRVQSLALRLAAGEVRPRALMRLIWDFMGRELSYGSVRYHEIDRDNPADLLLDGGWFDCQCGAALVVSMCRALGVPARLVSGFYLYETVSDLHSWMEVWFDDTGWTPFDLDSLVVSNLGRSSSWEAIFFGGLNHRLVVERPPRLFSGPGSVRLPAAWQLVAAGTADGVRMSYYDLEGGALVYSDHTRVRRVG